MNPAIWYRKDIQYSNVCNAAKKAKAKQASRRPAVQVPGLVLAAAPVLAVCFPVFLVSSGILFRSAGHSLMILLSVESKASWTVCFMPPVHFFHF